MEKLLLPACLLCAVAGALPGGEAPPSAFPGAAWQASAPEEQGVDAQRLRRAMTLVAAACGSDGTRQAMVVRNGRVIWQGDDVATRRAVWSCTKSFLSACLGLLWDDGRCDPETRVAAVLPHLAATYPDVTLGHLATFTSGYNHAVGRPAEPASPLHAPGAAMHYSSQSDLLATALTRLAGEPLRDLFMRRIGAPIGIADDELAWGALDPPPLPDLAVNGGSGGPPAGIQITARAMARFGWLCCQGGAWDGKQLLSRRYLAAATAVRVPATTPPYEAKGWYTVLPGRYGLNWWLNGVGADGERLWPSAPASAFAAQGNRNNICIVIPDWQMVIVRLGGDPANDVGLLDGALLQIAAGLR